MKVMHIINDLKIGGLQKFVCELARESSAKHDVVLLVLNNSEKVNKYKVDNKVTVVLGSEKKYISKMLKIRKAIKKHNPNVIHTHGLTLFLSVISHFNFFQSSIKWVHTVHNVAEKEAGKLRRYIHWFSFKFLRVMPVTISNEVDESFRKYYKGIEPFKINNGSIEVSKTSRFNEIERYLKNIKRNIETKVIINVGRIDAQKNQKLLIEAFNELKGSYNIILLVAGSGVEKENLFYQEIVDKCDLENVYFLSEVDNVSDFLFCSDIFCLSSKFEGLPIALLEAMSVGLTCVCTRAGGTSMVINERVGYLSKDFKVSSLSNSLAEAIRNPVEKEVVKSEFIKNYTMEVCFNKYDELYEKLK
ncbi:glycosyltransferase [Marinomonas communis]|uniref:Glycosyltransferase involved in cell wall biosynthesis n=1 Tax=Marinomonas communis TaxID=28254 RepID=A0A4R6X2G3_9GAMM|nr:glycosyltransferase [Marinomonas communis]TDR13072.1 glycosyltransferase involved in cell wall biosynthesis [Marinomonas communis]